MDLSRIRALATTWREHAELFRAYGDERAATACELHAGDLEARLDEWFLEELTLDRAAAETGLAYDTVQKRVASGEWTNVGRKGAPRVRRGDILPGSPAEQGPRLVGGEPDIASEVLLSREGGSR